MLKFIHDDDLQIVSRCTRKNLTFRFFSFLNSMFSLSLRFTLNRLCLDLHIITNLLSRTAVDIITKLLKFVGIDM